jgi:predicted nucleotidyltransferase
MGVIGQLAEELGAPERTLRRAVAVGTIHSRRLSERRLRLANGEPTYLREHWPLISELRRTLRTEPGVRVAILAGSMARGDNHEHSDIDLVVELSSENPLDRLRLAMKLEKGLGRAVDVADMRQVRNDPLSLLQVLDEGRVIVDRDEIWWELQERRPAIHKRATRAFDRQRKRAEATTVKELLH